MLCPLRARNKKKNQAAYWRLSKKKNGRQIQKWSRQIVQEQKLRSEPHLIGIVVRLLGLNTLQKFHPPVATAWDSRSEQTFLKGFKTFLVCILTTILLPGYLENRYPRPHPYHHPNPHSHLIFIPNLSSFLFSLPGSSPSYLYTYRHPHHHPYPHCHPPPYLSSSSSLSSFYPHPIHILTSSSFPKIIPILISILMLLLNLVFIPSPIVILTFIHILILNVILIFKLTLILFLIACLRKAIVTWLWDANLYIFGSAGHNSVIKTVKCSIFKDKIVL